MVKKESVEGNLDQVWGRKERSSYLYGKKRQIGKNPNQLSPTQEWIYVLDVECQGGVFRMKKANGLEQIGKNSNELSLTWEWIHVSDMEYWGRVVGREKINGLEFFDWGFHSYLDCPYFLWSLLCSEFWSNVSSSNSAHLEGSQQQILMKKTLWVKVGWEELDFLTSYLN